MTDDLEDNMKAAGFGVFASLNGGPAGTSSATTYSLLMENERVYWTGTMWTYDNTKVWSSGCFYHFFGYYPHQVSLGDANPVSAVNMNSDGTYKLTFTTPSSADFDLCAAYTTVDTEELTFNPTQPLILEFGHELVNVNLNIWRDHGKHQNDKMRVTSVAISNIAWKGTLAKTVDGASIWTPLSTNPLYSGTNVDPNKEIGAARKDPNSSAVSETSGASCQPFGSDGLLLIPKANAVTLNVAYELQRENTENPEIWEQHTLPITLPVDTWRSGVKINYNLLLSNEVNLTFYYLGTTVTSWGTPQVGGTIIIK